jgi:hypothetical protein
MQWAFAPAYSGPCELSRVDFNLSVGTTLTETFTLNTTRSVGYEVTVDAGDTVDTCLVSEAAWSGWAWGQAASGCTGDENPARGEATLAAGQWRLAVRCHDHAETKCHVLGRTWMNP